MAQGLDVGYNQFSGSFNALLGSCEYIVSFQADGNMLSGSLPANVASLGLMVCLQIACQFVTGDFAHFSFMDLPERMLLSRLSFGLSSPCHVYQIQNYVDRPATANAYHCQIWACVLDQHASHNGFSPGCLLHSKLAAMWV